MLRTNLVEPRVQLFFLMLLFGEQSGQNLKINHFETIEYQHL